MSNRVRGSHEPSAESVQRLRAQAAEFELAEARELIAELHEQVSRANAAAVRMAEVAWAASKRLAA